MERRLERRLWDKHPEVGKEIGRKYLSADDGLFWMAWKDLSRIFDTVQVCARRMDAPRGTHRGVGSRGTTPMTSPVTSPVRSRKAGAVRSDPARLPLTPSRLKALRGKTSW